LQQQETLLLFVKELQLHCLLSHCRLLPAVLLLLLARLSCLHSSGPGWACSAA
jgi:hypothetical protein